MSLRSRVRNNILNRKLQGIEEHVRKELLRFWQVHAPHFTDHGVTHCENMISNLDRMIPVDVKAEMEEYEVFLLLCGVWLHDIGMLVKRKGESLAQVRDVHHKRGRQLIRTSLDKLDLTDDERYVVGEMAYYHRKTEDLSNVKEIMEIQHDSIVSKVRPQFLCALLRLADGCEVAHSRSSRELVEIAGIDDEARFHHEAHLHVSGVGFDPITHEITVFLRVKKQEDAELLTNFLRSSLEKELSSVKEVLKRNGIDYSTVQCDVTLDPYAREMPRVPIKVKEMSIEEKLAELERRTGYYPSMLIDEGRRIHVFYETISQTRKELQNEIVAVLEKIWNLFPEKKIVILTTNKIHDPRGTIGESDPEIITVGSKREEFEGYQQESIDKRELWNKLVFFRKVSTDQFHKIRVKANWPLVV
jgi:hypothetical protein